MSERMFGRYIYRKTLGKGGMGTVIQAYDPHIQRDVAVKILNPKAFDQRESLERFRREANTIAKLEHPAIVPMYDHGIESGRPYLVMRLMKGGTLADRILRGRIPLQTTVNILKQVSSAVDYAHEKGVIHRDIKPTNILFDDNDNAHLADFGIVTYLSDSTLTKHSQTRATRTTGVGLGTPGYMSPEQITGKPPLDMLTDIYSFGVIIYEMLTGNPPYIEDTEISLIFAHVSKPVPRILEVNSQLPVGCDIVIQRTMAKKREDRYQTAGAAVADLEAALQGKPLAMTALMPPPPTRRIQTTRTAPPKKKTPWLRIFSVFILLVMCVMVAGWIGMQWYEGNGVTNAVETPMPTQEVLAVEIEPEAPANQVAVNSVLPTNTLQPISTDAPLPTATPIPTNTTEPSATPLPTFTPTPMSIPQFYDSFDAGISPEWDYDPDDWGTVNGQLVSLRKGVERMWIGHETWQNYSVEMDVIDVSHIGGCPLRILQSDDTHYLTIALEYDGLSWYKDGALIPNTEVDYSTIRAETPFKLLVTAQNNIVTTFIDGEQINQYSISGYQAGKIGLHCGISNVIDNFIVTPLN